MPNNKIKSIDPKIDKEEVFEDFSNSDRYITNKRAEWDDKEKIFFAKLSDDISDDETKSQIHDPRLSTYIIERSGRVIAQLPRGRTFPISKSNRGKAKLMDLILDKYVLPNANSQFPLLTKLKLMQVYSNIYGSSFGLVDWLVDKRAGYIGPDLWLIGIRDFFPQVGAVSLEDSDYAMVSTIKTKSWLKSLDPDLWQNIDIVLDKMADTNIKSTSRSQLSSERISTRYSEFYTDDSESKRNPYIEVITRYERDKWITFLPDHGEIIRVIENPHDNGMLPIVAKHNFPILEDFYGLGEFERSETLQKSLDSLINLYFDGVKMSLFPPLQINTDGVTPSSIKMRPGSKWFVDRPNVDVQPTQVSPRGLETFTTSYQYLLGALQNSQGTSETNISSGVDSTMGKTPQALRMQLSRENTRDSMERYQMEQTVTQIMNRFINLESKKIPSSLVMTLFDKEIDEIIVDFPDLVEIFEDGKSGKITINKEEIEGKYIYDIDSGSMSRKDEVTEVENLSMLLRQVLNGAQIEPQSGELVSPILKAFEKSGKRLDVAEMFKRIIVGSGVDDWDKIVLEKEDLESKPNKQAEDLLSELNKTLTQMGGNQPQQPNQQRTQQQPQQPIQQGQVPNQIQQGI